MSVIDGLYNLTIMPIQSILEAVFYIYMRHISFLGVYGAIISVSIVMNFLALPIYNQADSLSEIERNRLSKMSKMLSRIKQTFTGDERFMLSVAYYKEQHYNPLSALGSSLSVLIEIPFFLAAYNFLSHCPELKGAGFWLLRDLGQADALVTVSAFHLNILPIIMTAINVMSATVYLKGMGMRERVQTYGMAAIFLFLLYNSPCGLVFYWILNQLFSLAKNLVLKHTKKPGDFTYKTICVVLDFAALFFLVARPQASIKRRLLLATFAILFSVAKYLYLRVYAFVVRKHKARKQKIARQELGERGIDLPARFLFSLLGTALLCGWLLPCGVIGSEPLDFCFVGETANPLVYVWQTITFYMGLFVVWPYIIYRMSKYKYIISYIAFFVLIVSLLNVYAFGFLYGNMTKTFKLNDRKILYEYPMYLRVLPFVASSFLAFVLYKYHKKLRQIAMIIAMAICTAQLVQGGLKYNRIQKAYLQVLRHAKPSINTPEDIKPLYHFSKTNKNVVVLFLDCTISSYFPYFLKQFPNLQESYSGFVYYPNTVSHSNYTVKATPAMLGGYEYTPANANKRPRETLLKKHNEATLVMPRLFAESGYAVTVSNPPLPNYGGDRMQPFLPYRNIETNFPQRDYRKAYICENPELDSKDDLSIKRRLKGFAFMQVVYPVFREFVYDKARYLCYDADTFSVCIDEYSFLYYLDRLTTKDNDEPQFMFIGSELTHQATIMKEPEYKPAYRLDASKATTGVYVPKHPAKDNVDSYSDVTHYHVNLAGILLVAKWLDKLKELNVYDNTRVVIVSDHCRGVPVPCFEGMNHALDYAWFNPLLMVKDFNAHGDIQTDNTFMTNADTVFLATQDLDIDLINPFTRRNMNDFVDKSIVNIYPLNDYLHTSVYSLKNTWRLHGLKPLRAYSVHDNIFDESNWKPLD